MEALVEGELESGTGLNQQVGIKRPSDTRWGSHFSSLLNIKNIYSSICEVLEDLGRDNSDRDRKAEAICILRLLKSFDFVFCLHLMVDILGVTNHLNTTLQRKDQDIVNAMNQVELYNSIKLGVLMIGYTKQRMNVKVLSNEIGVLVKLLVAGKGGETVLVVV
ncbi:unnamed protein product [Lactuca saligna]|uniref:Uncharacterized protein n=1 Tax=Lactuca saligna TaxID=75948 RepID=A0AA35YS19_LACSI|nr:unnamed protein product [Lactuca saligna]